MSRIRRINLLGGPGLGKSTSAAFIFQQMKQDGYKIELVTEYIKTWTYIPRSPKSWDSFYCQMKQVHQEDIILRSGMPLIVTDSPVFLGCFYAWHHGNPGVPMMLDVAKRFEEMYPSLTILLERGSLPYDPAGRYEDYEQALDVDEQLSIFAECHIKFEKFPATKNQAILDYIKQKVRSR